MSVAADVSLPPDAGPATPVVHLVQLTNHRYLHCQTPAAFCRTFRAVVEYPLPLLDAPFSPTAAAPRVCSFRHTHRHFAVHAAPAPGLGRVAPFGALAAAVAMSRNGALAQLVHGVAVHLGMNCAAKVAFLVIIDWLEAVELCSSWTSYHHVPSGAECGVDHGYGGKISGGRKQHHKIKHKVRKG